MTASEVPVPPDWADRLVEGEAETLLELFHPVARVHGLSDEGAVGRDEFIAGWTALRATFAPLSADPTASLNEGARTVLMLRFSGTHSGDGLGFSPTLRKVDFFAGLAARWEAGKIVESWAVMDMAAVYRQLSVNLQIPVVETTFDRTRWQPDPPKPYVFDATPGDALLALNTQFFVEVWQQQRVSTILRTIHPSNMAWGVVDGRAATRDEFIVSWRAALETFGNIHFEGFAIRDGGWVGSVFKVSGCVIGPGLGFAPTGLPISFWGMVTTRWENAHGMESYNVLDMAAVYRQTGIRVLGPAD